MNLIDFDMEIKEYLLENGFTHAVLKPLLFKGQTQLIEEQAAMEVVPFKELEKAHHYLDHIEVEALVQSTIISITDDPLGLQVSGTKSVHLLIDVELVDSKAA